ncbi:hypothetical protein ACR77V_12500 [Staphylococcus epidermidis]|uniref:hypothetical protein n=1 Tax=Staphylococcus epidermidis TaxID=1282 RepID=UPI003DA6275E
MNAQQAIRAAAAFRAGLMFIRGLNRTMAQDAQIKGGWITIGAKKADAEGKGGRKGIHVKVDDNGRVVAGLGGKRSKGKSLKAAIRGLNAERERAKNDKLNGKTAEIPQKSKIKSKEQTDKQTDKQTESKQIRKEQTPEQKAANRLRPSLKACYVTGLTSTVILTAGAAYGRSRKKTRCRKLNPALPIIWRCCAMLKTVPWAA